MNIVEGGKKNNKCTEVMNKIFDGFNLKKYCVFTSYVLFGIYEIDLRVKRGYMLRCYVRLNGNDCCRFRMY